MNLYDGNCRETNTKEWILHEKFFSSSSSSSSSSSVFRMKYDAATVHRSETHKYNIQIQSCSFLFSSLFECMCVRVYVNICCFCCCSIHFSRRFSLNFTIRIGVWWCLYTSRFWFSCVRQTYRFTSTRYLLNWRLVSYNR